ncbi:hypothetical protein Q4I30_007533 [Leishmania utingensis]|uniref:EF-hand domain-containing protein n=1 Tax=Leishmania utingensis TaxID=653362 RepID=A0AAW2ZXW0_9TRYP
MFRSWGELTSCASEVFNLFAEPISATDRVNPAAPSQEATETAEVGLSRAGLECAFYVLFGRYPTPSLIADCFARPLLSVSPARCTSSASPRQSPRDAHGDTTAHVASRFPFAHPDAGRSSHAGAKCFVTRSAYLRFVMLCAEEEGDGFLMERPQGDGTASGTATALSVDGKKVAQLQWWLKFQSVAGAKGFIAASDLLGIDLQGPFTDVPEVLAAQCSTRAGDSLTAAQRKLPASRQAPLVQHVFWMLDRDHDGSVRFDDVRPYLQEC